MRTVHFAPASRFLTALLLALNGAMAVAAPPAAQIFDSVAKPEQVDAKWREALCALLPQPCADDSLALYRPRGATAGAYVVLAAQPLALARVQRDAAGAWRLEKLHDLSGYRHSKEGSEEGRTPRLSLAPALYPLGEERWAAAVLWSITDGYSGGGASFSTADFVPLDAPARAADAERRGIPFSCSQMIRACFSEKEYRSSRHCHDETSGGLRIDYGAQPGAPWRYRWLETTWPAHVARSASRAVAKPFTAQTAADVPFCGGPQ